MIKSSRVSLCTGVGKRGRRLNYGSVESNIAKVQAVLGLAIIGQTAKCRAPLVYPLLLSQLSAPYVNSKWVAFDADVQVY
jgi:hypothetical protein